MLSSIRKFSTSIYAKILLGIIVIPFVFWGMGTSFRGGSKNVIVIIDKEKFSTQEFVNFVTSYQKPNEIISSEKIDEFLSLFIGNKLIEKEYDYFGIKLSDYSLSKLIKIQTEFKKENEFSRIKYEKFLLVNNLNAVTFEKNLADQEKRRQLANFIGGGIVPPKFMLNDIYDNINQKRKIELINLNDLFTIKSVFPENEIKSYYEKNKEKYVEIYKSVKILEITPIKLIGTDDFNNIFFKKLDEIHDAIIQEKKLDSIVKEYNLEKANIFKTNKSGQNLNFKIIKDLPKDLIENIFFLSDDGLTSFIEKKDKFYIIEIIKTENIQRDLNNENVIKDIKKNLKNLEKRKLMSELISKVKQKKFLKSDFVTFSKNKNVPIQKITLINQNDNKILKKEVVSQIYTFPENKVSLAFNAQFTENFLIYIDKVINVSINDSSNEYEKYSKLTKVAITNALLSTYDKYIKEKYEIDINYKTLKTVKNYFN